MDRLLSMRVFEKVVEEGGFAAAARALDMSPPVVTRLVADLEGQFGTRLLQRTTRRQSLTDVASPAYLARRGMPRSPRELREHDCLRLVMPGARTRTLRCWRPDRADTAVDVEIAPVVMANHGDTLLRAALDGAGITSVSMDLVASGLAQGALVRVLHPWITGRLAMYAALPSRKFIPRRTQVLLDYLVEHTRGQVDIAMAAMRESGGPPAPRNRKPRKR